MRREFTRTARDAERIKDRRKARGMTQEDLARAMRGSGQEHWRQNTVSRVEAGRQEPSLHDARALIGLFGVDLFDDDVVPVEQRELLAQRVEALERSAADMLRELQILKADLT